MVQYTCDINPLADDSNPLLMINPGMMILTALANDIDHGPLNNPLLCRFYYSKVGKFSLVSGMKPDMVEK